MFALVGFGLYYVVVALIASMFTSNSYMTLAAPFLLPIDVVRLALHITWLCLTYLKFAILIPGVRFNKDKEV